MENLYDERINALIKDNYQQIRWIFGRANLDFIYLPMFFNDEETREKVLYYAPYLTSNIIENVELRSSYLLGYMSHQENREKITPSLLYSPKPDNEEWIFQVQTIDIDSEDTNEIIHWVEDIIFEINEELESAKPRRYIRYDEDLDEYGAAMPDISLDASSPVEYSSTPDLSEKAKNWLKGFSRKCVEEEDYTERTSKHAPSNLNDILDEDVRETLEELEQNIERLRLLGIPLNVIVDFVAKYETISRLLITDDLRIFLPDYSDLEVEMGPLCKAVYLLFLFHPEGIVLQRLEDHHNELVNYYKQTSGTKQLTPRMIDTIKRLEYPGDNTINYTLSRIKASFKASIDEHLAKHYYIAGRPGEPYKVSLNPDLIEWEDEDE